MFTKSIRWRLQLWQAFLLVCILCGFGVTAYQLHRTNQLSQIDEEMERRLAALSGEVRGPPPFGPPRGRPPFERDRTTNATAFDIGPPPGPPPFEPGRMTNASAFDFGPPPGRPPFEPDRDAPPPWRRGPASGPGSRGPRGWLDNLLDSREIRLSNRTLTLFDPAGPNDFYYAIWSRRGNLLKSSTNAPAGLSIPGRTGAFTGVQTRMRDANREAFQFTEIGECVLTGRSIASDLATMRRFAWWLVAAGGAVLAVGLGGGWLLATRAMRPLEDISATASRISVGNLAERINVAETDSELGRLAGVLNSTFARLEAAFAQQKQFTADASHELRTPIAVIISEAQTALARERTAAEYRETVEACLDTAQQMRRLAQSLLELARYDAGQEPIVRSPFNLAERARACIELISPLARERGIQIHSDLSPVEALGDADRLGQVITNLLTNAIQHNKNGGEVRVTTGAEQGVAVVAVADTGQGIATEDVPHIFERFHRADPSRARAGGCSGLGLAISKAIVDAHGGSIEVWSQAGGGATFTVRVPR
ncbi:MAG: HAMP domain-containing protein [Chloroflexi bacterium]|nr:HAMP domain-containing protein [Chloroflexota bacterium]